MMARVRPIEADQDGAGRCWPGISSRGAIGPDQEAERGRLGWSLTAGRGARRGPEIQAECWLIGRPPGTYGRRSTIAALTSRIAWVM